ncbi:hypothetical protein M3Y94_00796900 [Aphelenchoides besseyi]|nr:hypothetical protein M3Y94_00796900 [Aphelenchoides besseyi]
MQMIYGSLMMVVEEPNQFENTLEAAKTSHHRIFYVTRVENDYDSIVDTKVNVPKQTELTHIQLFVYSIGHFYNDLCASLWFNYLVFNSQIGLLMLIGQLTDALCTPIIGLLSDASILPHCLMKLGRRKFWYVVGNGYELYAKRLSNSGTIGIEVFCERCGSLGSQSYFKVRGHQFK